MEQVNAGKAAIFDLDGTLLDSMNVWNQVDVEFLGRRGLDMPGDYQLTISSMQFREIARYTIDRFGLTDTEDALMEEWSEMAREMYAHDVTLKPHAYEYLSWLNDSGAKLAVATTLTPQLRDPALRHLGIDGLFDVIVSVDDVNNVGKTEPDIYLHAARAVGVEPQDCTVFEDLYEGICSAKCAGMQVWAMYDESSSQLWSKIAEEADGTLHDFKGAPRLI